MFRWSAVFFIWAFVAAAFGFSAMGPVVSSVSWLCLLFFVLLFLFFAVSGLVDAPTARARSRP